MPALLALLALLAWLPAAASAELRASVEPSIIDELDHARLTIRITGSRDTGGLDLQPLEHDFEVITTQTASQYRSVNGRVESWVEYQIMLRPKRAGELTIPPIAVGTDFTRALTLQVRGLDAELRHAINRMAFFETELTTNPVYVRAQTVMIRRLYYSSAAHIYSDLPGFPEIADAVVTPLGQATSTTTVRDGQRYGVIEQRFAIFPEQSGTMTIPAVSMTSSVRLETAGRTRRSGVRIATDPVQLEVLPIPAEYPANQPWLPAENVLISEVWEPTSTHMEVGDPVRRVLRTRVAGNVSSIIPPLDPSLPESHFQSYPEPAELMDDADGARVNGSRVQSYDLIATAPGAVSIPAVEMVWWDVAGHQVRTSRAPARSLRITGTVPPQLPVDEPATAVDLPPAEPDSELDVRREQVPWPGPERRRALWLLLLGATAGIAALWVLGRVLGNWRAVAYDRSTPAAGNSERARWRALRHACRQGDQAAMHRALLAYLRSHFAASVPEALSRFREHGHGELLQRLNAGLYQPAADASGGARPVTGRELLRAVRDLRRHRTRRNSDPLPALYD